MPGLGRLQRTDLRDLNFMAADVLVPPKPGRTLRYWNDSGWWGDQGSTPKCVAYSFAHLIEDGPITQRGTAPIVDPDALYAQCKQEDGDPGGEGTYVRVAADILRREGWFESYRWCMTLNEIMDAVLENCPVLMGTWWYQNMFYPDSDSIIRPTGTIAGGHAWLLNGFNAKTSLFRMKNSWGRNWGNRGHALIHANDVSQLLLNQGEACVLHELKK